MTQASDNGGDDRGNGAMQTPPVVSRAEWDAAHVRMHGREKEVMRARDALAAERRRMPWLRIEKDYAFEGPDGRVGLRDLFGRCRQLIVYRAFLEPGVSRWPERGCIGCSLVADHAVHPVHLQQRDTTYAFVSRGSQDDLARQKAKMGWEHIPWYTLTDDFDADFGVDAWHGTNVFFRDGDQIFRTYFVSGRGDEQMGNLWNWLDITPLGRQEKWEDSPPGYPQTDPYDWWVWHDNREAEPERE
ncbi:DUF899 domain-containing protein [Allosphingosinicella indica]|uniref:Predicted dithiol-disulfide oxidoreductase, DUF899 family n=1 Tax=Allosphingosinicella indica TaxID=941907 RepID=A0A1X7G9W2_9SPHN|nr:DUF899 domain-containing protein [Allosphingosinicella indica]SMF65757.1 Predicted dithiol-disulfide oxidoreductase, DUF899 family [Allosphingosinicella indica]